MPDKFYAEYTIRIPEILKHHLSTLTPEQKKHLNEAIRLIMAKKVHESKFDPEKYFTEGEE